jgi:N-acetylglucosamine-6-phosphate deacetylase
VRMAMTVIRHAAVYTPDGVLTDGVVRTQGDRIVFVGTEETDHGAHGSLSSAQQEEEIDGHGLLLLPGLIDLQCNGIAGYDALAGDVASVLGISAVLPRYGCTAVMPTLISASTDQLARALAAVASARRSATGAAILGTHMEGPWLSPSHHGAHPPEQVRLFSRDEYRVLREAAAGSLRLLTLAPEMPGGLEAVALLVADGMLVSMGHSGADYDQALAGVQRGARMATHLFNAMTGLHHRAPGLVGAALTQRALVPGMIPDGHHLHPAIVRLVTQARAGWDVLVVTDSVPAAGLAPGEYEWRGRRVRWDGETVRLLGGGLAGSGLTPIEALRRLLRWTGLALAEGLPMLTSVPARLLGEEEERGSIIHGARADLILVTPALQVQATLVAGRVVYRA